MVILIYGNPNIYKPLCMVNLIYGNPYVLKIIFMVTLVSHCDLVILF